MEISVAITTYNDSYYLDRLLKDLEAQKFALDFEIILVDAGSYSIDKARACLGALFDKLIFIPKPGLSRTESLNLIFQLAKGDIIVRLDARSHIDRNYLEKIYTLSKEIGCENVGGVMLPTGLDDNQVLIANIMKHPFSFGGGASRKADHCGYADSVYLGAFRKDKCVYGYEWFDSTHPKISEDSDLNYRIRKNGGRIYIDSSILVQHYPRETLTKFFKLCFNYGVGRGLFLSKHKMFSAYRQLVPPVSLLFGILLLILSLFYSCAVILLLGIILIYLVFVFMASITISTNISYFLMACVGFIGCHITYIAGLIFSPIIYRRDLARKI